MMKKTRPPTHSKNETPLWLLEEFLKDKFPEVGEYTREMILDLVEMDRNLSESARRLQE